MTTPRAGVSSRFVPRGLLTLLLAGGVAIASHAQESGVIRAAAIEAHMRFLADDLLEGREAGTRGYDLAAAYVAAQFRLLGLQPAGDGGTYLQSVPLRSTRLVREGARMVVTPNGGAAVALTLGTDYVVAPGLLRTTSSVSAPAVFVGYGIEAPEFKQRDYEGLDVKGKFAVMFTGYPSAFPSEEGAHYGSGAQKARTAAAHGAIGVITIYTTQYESVYPWANAAQAIDSSSMSWIGPDGVPSVSAPALQISGMMSPERGALLFTGSPRSYADVRAEAAKGIPRGFPLAVNIELAQQSRHEQTQSANVAAVLPGSDPALKQEHVVLLGHLDHEGIGSAGPGDRIYNGALDNAAGIAALIETARALTSEPTAPRRSVLFLAVTAEEKGLVGSDYFARNPTVPRANIVAAVNLDMPILLYNFTDVIAFGAQHSTLKAAVESAAATMKLSVTPDPMPEQAIFTRSDHYRFVEQGVPSVFLSTGWNTPAGAGEGGKAFVSFLQRTYHQPGDDLTQAIDYNAGARFATVNYLIAKQIANADARPRWNDGNFFGNLFAKGR